MAKGGKAINMSEDPKPECDIERKGKEDIYVQTHRQICQKGMA